MTYYSSSQKKYFNVLDNVTDLRLSILSLDNISKEIARGDKFKVQYKNTHEIYTKLHNSTDEIGLKLDILKKFDNQLVKSNKSYQTVSQKQKEIEENLSKMLQAKESINTIFTKVYDYKLLQYMMTLELYEKNFLITKKIDLKKFGKIHFKMRRSVRGSENFTTNKPMQKKINESLIDYKKMLTLIVENQKEIDSLHIILKQNFEKTTKYLLHLNHVIHTEVEDKSENLFYLILLIASAIICIILYILSYLFNRCRCLL
jgi:hypothetical protein